MYIINIETTSSKTVKLKARQNHQPTFSRTGHIFTQQQFSSRITEYRHPKSPNVVHHPKKSRLLVKHTYLTVTNLKDYRMNKLGPIVIIEDDIDDQDILTDILKELNYNNKLIFFADGVQASKK